MYLYIRINYIWMNRILFFNEFVDLLIKSYLFRDLSSTQDKEIKKKLIFFLEYDLVLKIKQNATYSCSLIYKQSPQL